jgi:rod shape-determining protein MreD
MILDYLVVFAGIFLAHVLNGTTLFEFGVNIKPDFVVILVVFFALRRGEVSGLWVGFLGGLLTDASLGAEEIGGKVFYKIGVHSLSYSLGGYLLGKFGRDYYTENYLSITIYAFIMTFVMRGVTYFLFSSFFYPNENYSYLASSIYNAALAPLTFFLLSWVYRLEQKEGGR